MATYRPGTHEDSYTAERKALQHRTAHMGQIIIETYEGSKWTEVAATNIAQHLRSGHVRVLYNSHYVVR